MTTYPTDRHLTDDPALRAREAQIEGTRQDLSRNLDELTYRVSPHQVIERRKQATRSRLRSMRDSVMGTAGSARHSVASTGSGAADTVTGTAHGAVDTLERRTEGNPLAAGLVAFGAGMVLSSLLPATDKEAQAARTLVDQAKDKGQPLVDQARSVGQEMGQNLKDEAAGAAQEVKASAQQFAEHVTREGRSSAGTVRDETRSGG